ncbi:MAG: class A beta-lactamase-related serine hydrolase [Gemmatimonadales bacterium]|nr:MAG: class A beta-lactamase-related serine hydrolase [Gemmatimonadales bacterium]
MTTPIQSRSLLLFLVLALAPGAAGAQSAGPSSNLNELGPALDSIFAGFDATTMPGCAVGVDSGGEAVPLLRAWGMSDLEHGTANRPGTIFEAGSVSKQFTAAALLLLEQDGALSLDDDIRDHVPELPDLGEVITLRHLMTHTSGLRDWGSVAAIAGTGRGARTHTHDHVVDILSRQSALNFPPGDQYSYSNSGYNLMAVVVERTSGQSFASFSHDRIFEPLDLVDTHWRDDYRRLVPGRATAHSPAGQSPDGRPVFRINQPIEDVHGNGGLLTTVADLLTWNRALASGSLGDHVTREMHRQGILNSGDTITYAGGLMVGEMDGLPAVTHTGATAGYRAYLGRFPDQEVSVALLCNVTSANPGNLGQAVARRALRLVAADEVEAAQERVREAARAREEARTTEEAGEEPEQDPPTPAFSPSTSELREFTGRYYSPDAEVEVEIVLEEDRLVLLRRPADRIGLSPDEDTTDRFTGGLGGLQFHRDADGHVMEFGVSQARVFDLRFHRVPSREPAP